jgi:hypothetical protein
MPAVATLMRTSRGPREGISTVSSFNPDDGSLARRANIYEYADQGRRSVLLLIAILFDLEAS